jgi:hypothetical protein
VFILSYHWRALFGGRGEWGWCLKSTHYHKISQNILTVRGKKSGKINAEERGKNPIKVIKIKVF